MRGIIWLCSALVIIGCDRWSPRWIDGVDGFIDPRLGVTLHDNARVERVREQIHGKHLRRQWSTEGQDAGDWGGAGEEAQQAWKPLWKPAVFSWNPSFRMDPTWPTRKTTGLRLDATRHLPDGHTFLWISKHTSSKDYTGHTQNIPMTVMGECSSDTFNGAGFSAGELAYSYFSSPGWQEAHFGSGYNDGVARLYGITHATSGDIKGWVNGEQVGSTATSIHYGSLHSWACIGSGYRLEEPEEHYDGGDDGFVGDLGPVIVVSGVISTEDHGRLLQWAREERWVP